MLDRAWRYSHSDEDKGKCVGHAGKKQVLSLVLGQKRVVRETKFLWRRESFHSSEMKRKWGGRFAFEIERNPVQGIYFKQLLGQVYWRYWWELLETPRGGTHPRFSHQELLAVVLNGVPVFRIDNEGVSQEVRDFFQDAYGQDLVPVEQLLER